MPDPKNTLSVVREWISKAENDFLNATHTLKLGEKCPTDTVCFHAQQCAEKYIKALLVLENIDFSKTHDLEKLTATLPARTKLDITPEEMAGLTSYAVVGRISRLGRHNPL
ncbi:MAG: HEPN domain-containing protein [Nitrospinae bacterium]|nr:HEPN domain-containing protein [Nitrospinota bacterium]